MEYLTIIPEKELQAIKSSQEKILKLLETLHSQKSDPAAGFKYISEEKAKELLGKKTTWFWQQRTKGLLSFSKVGNSIFYLQSDITELLDKNFYEKFR